MTRAMYGGDDAKVDAIHVDQNRAFFYAREALIFLRTCNFALRTRLHIPLCSALRVAHRMLRVVTICRLFARLEAGHGGC